MDPAVAAPTVIAFRSDSRVIRRRAEMPAWSMRMSWAPQRAATQGFSGWVAGTSFAPIGDRPMAVRASAMVLAVN